MIEVEIVRAYKGQKIFEVTTQKWVHSVLASYSKIKGVKNKELLNRVQELSIVYVTQAQSQDLNSNYREKDKPTDVLSFEGDGFYSLGELVMCQDVIKEKSKDSSLTLKLYTQLLVVHGLLHLLGYEHETHKEDEKEMFLLQNKLMRKVAASLAPEHKNDFYV